MLDFIRIACAVPPVKVGNVRKNTDRICEDIAKADAKGVDLLIFPELSLTGYSCGDLFYQDALHEAVVENLYRICDETAKYPRVSVVVGVPVRFDDKIFDCACFVQGGKARGLVPKVYISNAESRWFATGLERNDGVFHDVFFGTDVLFNIGGVCVGIEVGEDLFNPVPQSTRLALSGADVVVNIAASYEIAGRREKRRAQVLHQSANCKCVYAFVSAGFTESTTDVVFSGHSMVAQNGHMVAENKNYVDSDYMLITDADLGCCWSDRRRSEILRTSSAMSGGYMNVQEITGEKPRSDGSLYPVRKLPFIPDTREERLRRCAEIFQLQVTGLKQRLSAIGGANAVIGISGGLDSTLALLVAVEAMRQLGRPATDVYGVTMPCFGTSDRTYSNSWELMRTLGISAKEINIRNAVSQHFADIGHDPSIHNATFENAQARERTQILMDYASVVGGIVVGTGDLSELALGWCTYNGDHMSMYGVNANVPKTLIRWMIDAISENSSFAASRAVLQDILDTPISPELLPPDAEGKISQQTEDLVGPYALHDFYLYHVLRYGFTPTKIYTLACRAFANDFDAATIKKWLVNFYRRFFTQQFKRSCMADGVKVGSVGLGPRGDWSMPSDAAAQLWLEEAQAL